MIILLDYAITKGKRTMMNRRKAIAVLLALVMVFSLMPAIDYEYGVIRTQGIFPILVLTTF